MSDFISMTCPNCSGKLEITEEIEIFTCIYCDTEYRVNHGSGIISLKPLLNSLKKVQSGTDKTASELALKRLKTEIRDLKFRIHDEFNFEVNQASIFNRHGKGGVGFFASWGSVFSNKDIDTFREVKYSILWLEKIVEEYSEVFSQNFRADIAKQKKQKFGELVKELREFDNQVEAHRHIINSH